MAPFAETSERSTVNVILAMAGRARLRQADRLLDYVRVARTARHVPMRAGQRVVRLRVMIEAPERPTVRVVAFAAFRAEASGVGIVGPVTRYAVQSRVLVGGI